MRLEKQVGEQDYIKELSPCNLGCCTENTTDGKQSLATDNIFQCPLCRPANQHLNTQIYKCAIQAPVLPYWLTLSGSSTLCKLPPLIVLTPDTKTAEKKAADPPAKFSLPFAKA